MTLNVTITFKNGRSIEAALHGYWWGEAVKTAMCHLATESTDGTGFDDVVSVIVNRVVQP